MHRPRAIAIVCLLSALGAARAGRPLQAEDADIMDPRACELEGAHSHWREQGAAQRQTSLQLGCGIGGNSEVALQLIRPRELALGGKTQFWRDGETRVTVAWNLAHRHVEAAWRRSGAGLVLVASAPLAGDWVLHANLGHQRDELLHRRSTIWALAAEHNGLGEGGRWQPMAELFGDDQGRPWANAALRVALRQERLFVDVSMARRLGGVNARLATAGFKLAF
ncbi:hypothetical protein [Roseateles sp.]|uniref:hypothetical protein n=1 Tax=Roseateles sp. TaxID=1971397 RepID=UPI0039EC50AF